MKEVRVECNSHSRSCTVEEIRSGGAIEGGKSIVWENGRGLQA